LDEQNKELKKVSDIRNKEKTFGGSDIPLIIRVINHFEKKYHVSTKRVTWC